jgi:hypothetical protein
MLYSQDCWFFFSQNFVLFNKKHIVVEISTFVNLIYIISVTEGCQVSTNYGHRWHTNYHYNPLSWHTDFNYSPLSLPTDYLSHGHPKYYSQSSFLKTQGVFVMMGGSHTPPKNRKKDKGGPPFTPGHSLLIGCMEILESFPTNTHTHTLTIPQCFHKIQLLFLWAHLIFEIFFWYHKIFLSVFKQLFWGFCVKGKMLNRPRVLNVAGTKGLPHVTMTSSFSLFAWPLGPSFLSSHNKPSVRSLTSIYTCITYFASRTIDFNYTHITYFSYRTINIPIPMVLLCHACHTTMSSCHHDNGCFCFRVLSLSFVIAHVLRFVSHNLATSPSIVFLGAYAYWRMFSQ